MINNKKRILVGLSGGVDSSIAAYLLKEQGYDVIGITMKIWGGDLKISENSKHACYGPGEEEDLKVAAEVCSQLGIKHYIVDLKEEYQQFVLDYFKEEYLSGKTPNPCVKCNQLMKFGFMLEKARSLGIKFDYFATGHYASISVNEKNEPVLSKAKDLSKDQTYFLAGLQKEQLMNVKFPLGNLKKSEVRLLARDIALEVANNPDSQDFIAGGNYLELFKDKNIKQGNILDDKNNILGKHTGIVNYTIGQRKGLGISASKPLYVRAIDAKNNNIIVTEKEKLFSKGLFATSLNFLITKGLNRQFKVKAKIRQLHVEVESLLIVESNDKVRVVFDEPQLSVTPGQTVVFYNENIVVGSGIIESSIE